VRAQAEIPGARAGARPRGDVLGQPHDRLTARIATDEQRDDKQKQRHERKQEGTELAHGGPG
jgi:hypothetical protein